MKCINKVFLNLIQWSLLAGLSGNLIGCAKANFSQGDDVATSEVTVSSENFSTSVVKNPRKNPHRCQQTGERCFSETFEQPVTNTRAVDVLFVLQTSDPLASEKQAIVSGISDFIASLPANADFNIAVMLAHGSTSTQSGRLYRAQTEPIVLKSTELSKAQIQSYLSTKLNQVVTDPDSGGGEEGLFSLFNAITTPALLAEAQAAGIFRPQAALGVIFVADRRDICAVVPPGVPAETDPVKVAARIRDCEGLTPAGLTNRLNALKGTAPLAVSGIIYADAPAPAGNEIGYGYTDVISLNAGLAIDIANDDIGDGLEAIAELSGQQMQIQNEFVLEYTGIDSKKIIVTVNGKGVPYVLSGNKVTIDKKYIPAGAVVVIAYCLQSKPQTQGCHHRYRKCWNKHHHPCHKHRHHKHH